MRTLIVLLLVAALTGCGTVGGMISGAGSDLGRVGDWIKSK
jgi:hypothetical protein